MHVVVRSSVVPDIMMPKRNGYTLTAEAWSIGAKNWKTKTDDLFVPLQKLDSPYIRARLH